MMMMQRSAQQASSTARRAAPAPAAAFSVTRPAIVCQAQAAQVEVAEPLSAPAVPALPRRLALMALSSLLVVPASQAKAYTSELCVMQDSDEEADACRRRRLEKDAGKQEDYNEVSERKFSTVSGVPVSVLDSEYVRLSNELIEEIEAYCTLDPYNKERIALVKKLKVDGVAWVSKYARGGSARSLSARRLYIAVDGVIGFLSSNGLAPYPKQKVKGTLATIEQAKGFLAEGK